MDWNSILEAATPAILALASAIITAALGLVSAKLPAFLRVYFDQKAAAAIHAALMNGLKVALQEGLKGEAAVNRAVGYAESSAKGSIDHFARSKTPVTVTKLQDQAKAKLRDLALAGQEVRP
ncbi:hypothetical protein ATO6_15295 [Oceanicola sp. 22II-s10i]|uniref:hypothetical protein n=1 Tax=Oceanicola sp. 22II-s10i TaxID=1317116 RepID=UPI000B51EBBF|nr:hypothetical protein [Oceanicola sp. 22II-s10i]OWU83797.1 hypothetical protein ATO6_15295 [Oceanicola sp. 22II-s10i]